MQETWAPSLGQEDAQEKGMATHSSILAWRTLWIEELMGYKLMRVFLLSVSFWACHFKSDL